MNDSPFSIAGRTFKSRLIVGTGKYSSHPVMAQAHAASGADMVVAVDEILVLREEIGGWRGVVIGPEDRSRAGPPQRLDQHAGAVGVNDHVGIDKPQDVAGRSGGADIARATGSQAAAGFEHGDGCGGGDRRAGIGRAVVDDDDLSDLAPAPHREQRLEALPQRGASVVDGHDDGDGERRRARAFGRCVQCLSPVRRLDRLCDIARAACFRRASTILGRADPRGLHRGESRALDQSQSSHHGPRDQSIDRA